MGPSRLPAIAQPARVVRQRSGCMLVESSPGAGRHSCHPFTNPRFSRRRCSFGHRRNRGGAVAPFGPRRPRTAQPIPTARHPCERFRRLRHGSASATRLASARHVRTRLALRRDRSPRRQIAFSAARLCRCDRPTAAGPRRDGPAVGSFCEDDQPPTRAFFSPVPPIMFIMLSQPQFCLRVQKRSGRPSRFRPPPVCGGTQLCVRRHAAVRASLRMRLEVGGVVSVEISRFTSDVPCCTVT